MTFYVNTHRSQYAPDQSSVTHREGCTWTSVANGADAATGGRVKRTPDQVHALVKPSEETNKDTPGWSLPDAQLAFTRLGIKSEVHTGEGWASVEHYAKDHYLLIQGDSDRFPDGCSGAFDGDHCIGRHPQTRSTPEGTLERIDDPICPVATFEPDSVLSSYARKFNPGVSFLVVFPAVPQTGHYQITVNAQGVATYAEPNGPRVGRVANVDYLCSRSDTDEGTASEMHWYQILSRADGKSTGHKGEWIKGYYAGHRNPRITIKGPLR